MKRIAWIFIVAVVLSMFSACTRRIEQLDEGLKSNLAENDTARNGLGKKYAIQEDNHDEMEIMESSAVQQEVSLYFWDKDNNKLVTENRSLIIINGDQILNKIVEALIKGPATETLKSVIPNDTKLLSIEQDEDIVTVNLSPEFLNAENILAARVALVNTLIEQPGVKYVKLYVEGKELTKDGTPDGEALGVLSKYSNNLDEVAASEKREVEQETVKEVNRDLYFGDYRYNYLLPEVRTLSVKDGGIIRAIVEELIKGPVGGAEEGLYPTIPSGTQLVKAEIQEGSGDDLDTAVLYFTKDLKTPFTVQTSSRGSTTDKVELNQQMSNKETILISSLVYSITALPSIGDVKIYYQDRNGEFIDSPLYSISLKEPLSREDFPNQVGRKIKVYFGDASATRLVPEYRAMSKESLQIATTVINELIRGPQDNLGHIRVIPEGIKIGDIKVWMDNDKGTAVVDLPSKLNENEIGNTGVLMTLYAIVNSLTDPSNTNNIQKVTFLIDGKVVDTFGNMELSEPFIRNPAIIQEG